MGEPIAFVGIVAFDINVGPCLVSLVPPLHDDVGLAASGLDEAAVAALEDGLPFKALPENGQAAFLASDETGGGTAAAAATDGRSLFFFLRVGGETLYGASHVVRLEDASVTRGFTQSAVFALARRPFFGLLLSRLHAFSTEVLLRRDECGTQLRRLDDSLRGVAFDDRAYAFAHADLPVARLVRRLRGASLSLVRLLLLEGRILLLSRAAGAVSSAALALAALLPGSLALGFGHDSPAFGARAYRWKKFGFPLKVFRAGVVALEPHLVVRDAAVLFASHRGFLAGTCNSVVTGITAGRFDCIVNLDAAGSAAVRQMGTSLGKAAFFHGERDRRFVKALLAGTKPTAEDGVAAVADAAGGGGWDPAPPAPDDAQWEGSSGWVVDRFQAHLEGIAAAAAACLERNRVLIDARDAEKARRRQRREEGRAGGSSSLVGAALSATGAWLNHAAAPPLVSVETSLEGWGRKWAEAWTQTYNFAAWSNQHSAEIASDPVAAAAAGLPPPPTSAGAASNGDVAPSLLPNLSAGASWSSHLGLGSPRGSSTTASSPPSSPPFFGFGGSSNGGASGSVAGDSSGGPTVVYPSGDTYTGELREGKRHGVGVYVERATGNTYEGLWRDDLRHGHGVLVSGAKDYVYDGAWAHDERTGAGRCVIRGIETYTGTFRDGRFHGSGAWCGASGEVYEGEFVDGRRQGAGRQQLPRGTGSGGAEEYVGEWHDSQRWGVGNCRYADGSSYSGGWAAGLWDGEGRLELAGGERHEGCFKYGKRHGPGTRTTGAGEILEGHWESDRPVGGGAVEWRLKFADGSAYVGSVSPDLVPHGRGTFKHANGEVYTGEFAEGRRSGQGICVFADGGRFEGEWADGAIAFGGKGRLVMPNGSSHEYS